MNLLMRRLLLAAVAVGLGGSAAACNDVGDNGGGPPGQGQDGTVESSPGASDDGGSGADALEASADTGASDAAAESDGTMGTDGPAGEVDGGAEAEGPDAPAQDAPEDVSAETSTMDAGPDVGPDSPAEATVDAAAEVGLDAPTDSPADVPPEAVADTGVDSTTGGGDAGCNVQAKCNAFVTANHATLLNTGATGGNSDTCSKTEELLYELDQTGDCLSCALTSGCLDLTTTSNTYECEDPITNGTAAECQAALACALGVTADSCTAGPSMPPAFGGYLNAYCGTDTLSACNALTSPTAAPGACAAQISAAFSGLAASQITAQLGTSSYAGGRAGKILNCVDTNCSCNGI